MDSKVRQYLSKIGRIGGKKSRRKLSAAEASGMARLRDARRAFRRFHASCFWSYDPDYLITSQDISWVAEQLMRKGNREAWKIGARLCR